MQAFNPIKHKLFWGLPGPRGRAHCAPLQNFIFQPIAMKFGTDVKTYLLQLMVQTLNETAIYHIKILIQHEMAPNTFYKWLNIPIKINIPCMEIMKTCCSEVDLNFESLSNCNFLNEIFFSYFIYNYGKKFIYKNKEKQQDNFFNFVLYYCIRHYFRGFGQVR